MKVKTWLLVITAISTILLLGCAGGSPADSLEISCEDFESKKHIVAQASINVGSSFTVSLCSNPTTGFKWGENANITDEAVLRQTAHRFYPPKETGTTGTPGKDTWTFKTLKEGKSTLTMEYNRPWEGGEQSVWTFLLNVNVK